MTRQGIATVARQEFTLRIRAGRWRWLLAAWFLVLLLVTLLLRSAVQGIDGGRATDKGVVVYGGLTLLVLGLALLVVPTLTAQSVNGDRERGTLATLQVTRLTAGDIATGKLAAAWGTSLVFLALTLPLVGYCMALRGVPLSRVVVVTLVVALLLGSVLSVALCLSSLLSRTTTSGVLAYLVVFGLTVGTTIAFGLATALTTERVTEHFQSACPPGEQAPGCDQVQYYETTRARTDRVWWLLAPNPFVVLADAAPQLPPLTAAERARRQAYEEEGIATTDLRDSDPLGSLGRSVRDLRNGPGRHDRRPVWPFGLAFDVALGGGALWLTARQLRTPARALPRGQRVA